METRTRSSLAPGQTPIDYTGPSMWDMLTAPARGMAAMPSEQNMEQLGLLGKIHKAIDPVQAFGGYGSLTAMALPPGVAFHGSPKAIQGAFKPSTRGKFGPGVYASEVEGVARQYGTPHQVKIRSDLDLFEASPRLMGEADLTTLRSNIFKRLTKEEQSKVNEWWQPQKRLSGEDVWEIMRRRLGDERAQSVIKDMGHGGITGIGDGQEIVVFRPEDISLANRPSR